MFECLTARGQKLRNVAAFVRKASTALTVALMAMTALLGASPAQAADPETRSLSREHVNLVRVQGRKITDVVFDTNALEISADKARGIVFVRVKSNWLATTDSDVTSAFFNTDTESFSVQFVVSAVPSQTIDLVPTQTPAQSDSQQTEARIALAAPLLRLQTGDYLEELKLLVRHAFAGEAAGLDMTVGEVTRSREERFAPLPAPEGSVVWEGFRVRETAAFVTADELVETLVLTRVSPKAGVPDAALLVQAVPGVLACAHEMRDERSDRLQTEITLIRSRAVAVRGTDSFESALTELSGAVPSRYKRAAAKAAAATHSTGTALTGGRRD